MHQFVHISTKCLYHFIIQIVYTAKPLGNFWQFNLTIAFSHVPIFHPSSMSLSSTWRVSCHSPLSLKNGILSVLHGIHDRCDKCISMMQITMIGKSDDSKTLGKMLVCYEIKEVADKKLNRNTQVTPDLGILLVLMINYEKQL